jgi:hypothetical protein
MIRVGTVPVVQLSSCACVSAGTPDITSILASVCALARAGRLLAVPTLISKTCSKASLESRCRRCQVQSHEHWSDVNCTRYTGPSRLVHVRSPSQWASAVEAGRRRMN